jgi:hypothetical protein
MGIFSDNALSYLDHGLRVFPAGRDTGKKPLIQGWQKLSHHDAIALVDKFPDANIAVIDGDRITIIDVDEPKLLDFAVEQYGDTPIKVQTPSGFHLWYAANGERRRHRVGGKKIDLLGRGGYGIAPPSVCVGKGEYRFIEGGLDDIDLLSPILPDAFDTVPVEQVSGKYTDGYRTNKIFAELRKIAGECETIDELEFKASGFNEALLDPPLSEAELNDQVRGVWKLKQEGRLVFPGSRTAIIPLEEGRTLYQYPPALALWHYLKVYHGPSHIFAICSDALAPIFGMNTKTITKARNFLVENGYLVQVHVGGGEGNPHKYSFSLSVYPSTTNPVSSIPTNIRTH